MAALTSGSKRMVSPGSDRFVGSAMIVSAWFTMMISLDCGSRAHHNGSHSVDRRFLANHGGKMHSIVATVNRPATAPVATIEAGETYCEPHMRGHPHHRPLRSLNIRRRSVPAISI
jgi:hypothetical protein